VITLQWWEFVLCVLAAAGLMRLYDTWRQVRAANRVMDRLLERELDRPPVNNQELADRAARQGQDG
jgi:hypothetical protein